MNTFSSRKVIKVQNMLHFLKLLLKLVKEGCIIRIGLPSLIYFLLTLNVVLLIFSSFFLSKRPKCLQNNGPFSIFVIVNPKSDGWYEVTPVGVNKINEIMKEIYANSNLECNKRTAIH